MTLQALAYWGGINDLVSASMTYTPGISPNVATLQIPPQNAGKIFSAGPLVWQFGPESWTFQRCRVDSLRIRQTQAGIVWELSILDRRWIWSECGRISGFYNARQGEKLKEGTEKKPQELAALCLEAMKERRFDVSALPNDGRPEVDWDYIRPAEALARLCDSLGCVVCLDLDDRVRIRRKFIGRALPKVDARSGDIALSPPDPPGEIAIACARTRFQGDLELEPVGVEADGEVKPIDELSYAQDKKFLPFGWGYADIHHFSGLPDDSKAKALAQESVFRWFRIKTPFRLPGVKKEIKDVRRVLPLESEQVELWTHKATNRQSRRPAWLYGEWSEDETTRKAISISNKDANLEEKQQAIWQHGFSIDNELGIIKLSEPCFLFAEGDVSFEVDGVEHRFGGKQIPPKLFLRTAMSVRDEKNWGWFRKEVKRKFSGRSAAPDHVRYYPHDDVIHELYTDFAGGKAKVVDNIKQIKKIANYYLDDHAIEYNPEESASVTYAGLKRLQPDGAVKQVGWSIQGGRGTTQATRNREELTLSVPYHEKRFLERVAQDQIERNKPERQRQDDAAKKQAPT